MAVINSTKIGILYPESSSWVLDYFIEAFSSSSNDKIEILKECSNTTCKSQSCSSKLNSWNRANGFSNVTAVQSFESLIIPCIYPFSASKTLLSNLLELQKTGTKIILAVLDPLVIGELVELFDLADVVQVFDQRDFNAVLVQGVSDKKVEVLPYPLLENCKNVANSRSQVGLIFELALGYEFRQVIISSLYESLEHTFKVCRVPSLTKNFKEGDFDNSFEQTIANRGLSARVQFEKDTLEYQQFKNYFSSVAYCVIPGDNLDAMCERRALLALAMSYDLPVVLESQRSPLSLYQGQTFSVEGPTEKVKGYSLSSAYRWVQKMAKGTSQDIHVQAVSDDLDAPLIVLSQSLPRILFKMRPNVFSQSGGDSILLNRLVEGLKERGFDAIVDLDGREEIKNFDLVHLFNFALKDHTENLARQCVQSGVPYVVTSLYEDWPVFFNQMMATYQCFEHYIKIGQPAGIWDRLEAEIGKVPPSAYWDNTYTAVNSKAVLTTGSRESDAVKRDYPDAPNVRSIALGSEVAEHFDGGKLFRDKYGLSDFILCVGRLETRKNQLMLLKALEDTEHTIVFAANNFTYQPEYAELCKNFKRKGRTVFLEKLESQELASAYQAAKVHALPSWYELPGLVSLEAGRYGANVVASKNGTIEDYLGGFAFYCEPGSYVSIREAVTSAFNAPKSGLLKEKVSSFTWEKTLDSHVDLYMETLGRKEELRPDTDAMVPEVPFKSPQTITTSELLSMSAPSPKSEVAPKLDVEGMLKAADILMAKEQYQEAFEAYQQILKYSPESSRVYRSLGVASLQLNDLAQAKESFRRALAIDQMDIKALIGVGAVEWALGRKQEAYEIYRNAANLDSSNQTAILYLVNSSYELNRLSELETVLREYLKNDPENTNIQYCLAGCFFKQNKLSLAAATVERILRIDENHVDALELKAIIASKNQTSSANIVEKDLDSDKSDANSNSQIDLIPLKSKLEKMKLNRKFEDLISDVDSYEGPKSGDYNDLLILKAEALGCMGKKQEAIDLFREIETKAYKLGKVYCGLGALRASMGEWKEAEALFIRALEEDSTLDMPLCGLGMCAEADSQLEDAWNYFIESAKRNPENIQAITGVIRIGYRLERLADVEVVLKDYLELKPVDLYMLYALAGCLYAQGRTDEAVKELRNILIFEPANDKATELLSEIESGRNYRGASV